jgi:hypothetical protein
MDDFVPVNPEKRTAHTSSKHREERGEVKKANEAWSENNTYRNRATWKFAFGKFHETYSQMKDEELDAQTITQKYVDGAM